MNSFLAGALLAIAFAPLSQAQSPWTVNPDGTGDFTSLQVAIDSVEAGDTLKLESGVFGDEKIVFRINKSLTLIGSRSGLTEVSQLRIVGAASFSLSNIRLHGFTAAGVRGTMTLDAVELDPYPEFYGSPTWDLLGHKSRFILTDCSDTRISRSALFGAYVEGASALTTMVVQGATNLQVVDSIILGLDTNALTEFAGRGGHAVQVFDQSNILVANSLIEGGNGEDLWFAAQLILPGEPGVGFEMNGTGNAEFRGNSKSHVRGGNSDLFGGKGEPPYQGAAILNNTAITVLANGITVDGPTVGPVEISPATAPFLSASSLPSLFGMPSIPGPGKARDIEMFGTMGSPGFLVASLGSELADHPQLSKVPIWLDLNQNYQVTPLALTGFQRGAIYKFVTPDSPAYAGIQIHMQGVEVTPKGFSGTNSVTIDLNF